MEFEEITKTFGKQNPTIAKNIKKWKSFTFYASEQEGNYNESRLLVIGLDMESSEMLQILDHKLHFNLWYITFKEWNNKEDEPKPNQEKKIDDPKE